MSQMLRNLTTEGLVPAMPEVHLPLDAKHGDLCMHWDFRPQHLRPEQSITIPATSLVDYNGASSLQRSWPHLLHLRSRYDTAPGLIR